MTFGEARQRAGMTLPEAARAAETSTRMAHLLERGSATAQLDLVAAMRLLDVYGVTDEAEREACIYAAVVQPVMAYVNEDR